MTAFKSDFLNTLQERGFIHQCSDFEGLDALAAKGQATAYVGYDCTARSLHIGNYLTMIAYKLWPPRPRRCNRLRLQSLSQFQQELWIKLLRCHDFGSPALTVDPDGTVCANELLGRSSTISAVTSWGFGRLPITRTSLPSFASIRLNSSTKNSWIVIVLISSLQVYQRLQLADR